MAENGNYQGSAEVYEELARIAIARNGPRAPWLLLQAGRMRIQNRQVERGINHLQEALALFAARNQWQQVDVAGARIVSELRQKGFSAEANQVENLVKTRLPAGFIRQEAVKASLPSRRVLPVNCPGCGGPLHSNEVEWTDEITAECPFCGSAVRAED
jgi:endogenous inhibitor of DNA gyrase (YacG/DUF329 family)